MRLWFTPAALFLTLLLWANTACAGQISIQLHCVSSVDSQGVTVRVEAANNGDDEALNVRLTARFETETKTGETTPRLRPGEKTDTAFRFQPRLPYPGMYAAVVTADFQDTYGYRFSALSWALFSYGEKTASKVTAEPARLDMATQGCLAMTVRNSDREARRVRVRFFSPTELKIDNGDRTVKIGPDEEKEIQIEVKNLTGRAGAEYPIPAFLEYEADERHFLTVVRNQVYLLQTLPFFKKHWIALTIIALVLLVISVGMHFIIGRKGNPKH
jgi:uncharacterized protein (DUF58 family)